MKCPHCSTGINVEWEESTAYINEDNEPKTGTDIVHCECPECSNIIVKLRQGMVERAEYSYFLNDVQSEEVIYPKNSSRFVEKEVPEPYKGEFIESNAVINISPKASAALSRRILQNILRQEYKINYRSLAQEIDAFIKLPGVPSHLSGAVDAIRNVGNFAAHPLKDTNTRAIADVEPGEAEWLLDVLEALFDFTFVQPIRLDERKESLNKKLKGLGKPPMKE